MLEADVLREEDVAKVLPRTHDHRVNESRIRRHRRLAAERPEAPCENSKAIVLGYGAANLLNLVDDEMLDWHRFDRSKRRRTNGGSGRK